MKILKWGLYVVLTLLALMTIAGFLSPRVCHVERSLLISADSKAVFGLVNSPAEFRRWSPWTEKDPKMTVTTFGPQSGPGSGFTWASNNSDVGDGTWKVSESKPYTHVGVDLDLGMGNADVNFNLTPRGDKTEVLWSLDIDNGMNPFSRLFGLGLDAMVGPDYTHGLENLENLALKIPKGRVAYIEEVDSPERYALAIRMTVPAKDVGNAIGQSFPTVMGYITQNNIQMSSSPFAMFHSWDPSKPTDFSAGVFVAKPEKGSTVIKPLTIPKSRLVVATYYGPYEKIELAYNAIDAWAKQNNKQLEQSPWEEYVTNPGMEPDPSMWMTKVCFVVK